MSQAGKLFDGTILPDVETLTGNAGGAVGPTGGNINVVGDGTTISITGNPGTSTLTASFIGTTDITITGDTGGAQTGNSFTFNGGTTGLSFGGAADVFTTTFAGITANGGTVSLATDATNSTINIGTGAGVKTSTFGSTNTTSATSINSGTGNITLNSGLTVDSSGRMTNGVQPCFLAVNSVTDTNATGDGTVVNPVEFNSEIYDVGGNFASNVFTAPKTGKYYLSAVVLLSSSTTGTSGGISIITTARTYAEGGLNNTAVATSAGFCGLFGFALADMTAGDTAQVSCTVSGGAKTVGIFGNAAPFTFFQGYLVA